MTLGVSAAAPARISWSQAPERTAFVAQQKLRIESHPYFSTLAFSRVEADPQYLFLVQVNPKHKPGEPEKIAKSHLAWMKAVEARFVDEVKKPAALDRARGGAPHVVFVLNTQGDYRNFIDTSYQSCATYAGACYDSKLSATVLFQRSFGNKAALDARRRDQRHAFVHSLQQAWGVSGFKLPGPEWLAEGQAVLHSFASWYGAEASDSEELPAWIVKTLVETEQKGGHKTGALRSVRDLVSAERRSAFRRQLGRVGRQYWPYLTSLSLQCGAFVHFLGRDANSERKKALATFTGHAMRTRGNGLVAATRAFGDMEALDKEFWAYLHEAYRRAEPSFSPKALAHGSAPGRKPAGTKGASVVEAGASAAPFDPTVLAIREDEVDVRFGLALFDARSGELDLAVSNLEAIDPDWADVRMTRELERIRAFRDARDAFLSHAAETKSKLRVTIDGDKTTLRIKSVENGTLQLEKNKRGLKSIPVSTIDLVELSDAIRKADKTFGSPLALAYAYALAGDDRLETRLRRVKDDGGLRADAQSLKSHCAVGKVASLLRSCSSVDLDMLDAASANELIESIARLLSVADGVEFVQQRRDGLRSVATEAFALLVDEAPLDELFHANVKSLDDGRVSIHYDFSSSDQLRDFVRDDRYQSDFRLALPSTNIQTQGGSVDVSNGALWLSGSVGVRLPLSLEGEQSVRYTVRIGSQDSIPANAYAAWRLSICDDRALSMVSNTNFGALRAENKRTGFREIRDEGNLGTYLPGREYAIALEHDGSSLTSHLDGTYRGSVPVGDLLGGELFLLAHCNMPVQLNTLTWVGRPAGLSAWRTRATNERVAKLFGD
ncbi:MAG: hypothetical protein AAGG01_14310 [Planctomycetota bacterium]